MVTGFTVTWQGDARAAGTVNPFFLFFGTLKPNHINPEAFLPPCVNYLHTKRVNLVGGVGSQLPTAP